MRASARAASSRGFTFSTARRCLPARLYSASAFCTTHVMHDQSAAHVQDQEPTLPCETRSRVHVTTKGDRQYEYRWCQASLEVTGCERVLGRRQRGWMGRGGPACTAVLRGSSGTARISPPSQSSTCTLSARPSHLHPRPVRPRLLAAWWSPGGRERCLGFRVCPSCRSVGLPVWDRINCRGPHSALARRTGEVSALSHPSTPVQGWQAQSRCRGWMCKLLLDTTRPDEADRMASHLKAYTGGKAVNQR